MILVWQLKIKIYLVCRSKMNEIFFDFYLKFLKVQLVTYLFGQMLVSVVFQATVGHHHLGLVQQIQRQSVCRVQSRSTACDTFLAPTDTFLARQDTVSAPQDNFVPPNIAVRFGILILVQKDKTLDLVAIQSLSENFMNGTKNREQKILSELFKCQKLPEAA